MRARSLRPILGAIESNALARRSSAPEGRYTGTGSAIPFSASSGSLVNVTAAPAASTVAASHRTWPSAAAMSRAARFTVDPRIAYSARSLQPKTPPKMRPVATPIETAIPCTSSRRRSSKRGGRGARGVVGVGERRQSEGRDRSRPLVVREELVEPPGVFGHERLDRRGRGVQPRDPLRSALLDVVEVREEDGDRTKLGEPVVLTGALALDDEARDVRA